MIKMLLLLFILITNGLLAVAQKSVLVSDSIYFADFYNPQIHLNNWDKHF